MLESYNMNWPDFSIKLQYKMIARQYVAFKMNCNSKNQMFAC